MLKRVNEFGSLLKTLRAQLHPYALDLLHVIAFKTESEQAPRDVPAGKSRQSSTF